MQPDLENQIMFDQGISLKGKRIGPDKGGHWVLLNERK